jgi:hypothetical protein
MRRTPVEPVSDVLLLAAVERAQRHHARGEEGVLWRDVLAHLGLAHSPLTTRRLRPQRDALLAAGLLSCSRRHGLDVWAITGAGRGRFSRARHAGEAGELPESPQHREWHDAREAAADRIDEFRARTRSVLGEAESLLVSECASSDAWFELAERLRRVCWTLGSATYCLREWPEPDDAHADTDEHGGRRNIRRWD